MGKGKHKGAPRRFTNFAAENEKLEKEKKEQEWRRRRGELDSESEEEGSGSGSGSESESENESGSGSEEDSKAKKPKGVTGLIAIENPNHVAKAPKKVKEIDITKSKGPDLSRRQKEELARQNYEAMHAAGKTEQARSDLERLAIIRKRREEAEQKKKEAAAQAKDTAAGSGGSGAGGKGARSKK